MSIAHMLSVRSQIVDYFDEEKERMERKRLKALSKVPVQKDVFQAGLHGFGVTANGTSHAFLELSVTGQELHSIMGIEEFKYIQHVDLSDNQLITLRPLSALKHLIKINASNNNIVKMLDFDPPANLQYVDYSFNQIKKIANAEKNPYIREMNLNQNLLTKIEGLENNKCLRVLSINRNNITVIENLDFLNIEELRLSQNRITAISGLSDVKFLKTLDLTRNQIVKLKGLEDVESLRFLHLCANNISKVRELAYIENLPLLSDLDLSYNPIQERKYYRLQALYHIPQLRKLDGQVILPEEKIKAENLHGLDLEDRKTIFKSLLPEEKFVDRRIKVIEEVALESESEEEKRNFIDHFDDMKDSIIGGSVIGGSVTTPRGIKNASARMSMNTTSVKDFSEDRVYTASLINFSKKYVGEVINHALENEEDELME